MPKLVSVNVGLPKEIEWRGQRVYTGIWKQPVDGTRTVRRLNVDGDGQGDLAGHGGEHRAVFVYQTSSYDFWANKLKRTDFTPGQFGENFTIEGLPDDEVRIGDRLRIGSASFEVTQPRVTCYRVGIRMNDAQMPSKLVVEGRPGFYLRVLQEGDVRAGDEIELTYRDAASVTVAAVDALLYRPGADRNAVRQALQIPALSSGWRASLQAILDQPPGATGNAGLAPAGNSATAQPGFRKARIVALSRITADVMSVALEPEDAGEVNRAEPGQYIVFKAPAVPPEPALMRSYSLTGTPSTRRYEIGVKCEPNGAMGRYMSERAREGDRVEISAPRGTFVLHTSERPVVLMSAGIGITPVLAMLKALVEARSTRPVWWVYGARNGAEHPFGDVVRDLLSKLAHARSHVRYSRPASTDRVGRDFDSVGRVDAALGAQLGIEPSSDFYLCGPAAFLSDMKTGLAALRVPSAQIYSEVFGSGPGLKPGIVDSRQTAPHQPLDNSANGALVSFGRSGLAVRWGPQYGSLLELAEACDVPTRWSCRTGVCHTCESGLISGEVSYEPAPVTPPEMGNVLICCARPNGDVVVDL